jgi:cytochrome oxidase Cu insertion factor (SCO1/SenC/PrrC family)
MRHRFTLLALLVVVALAVAGCGGDPPPDPPAAAPTTADPDPDPAATPPSTRADTTRPVPAGVVPDGERQPAPDISVTDFDGRTITLGGLRGQPVVVNFFESW